MRGILAFVTAALTSLLLANAAQGDVACSYKMFKPEATWERLSDALAGAGLAKLPAGATAQGFDPNSGRIGIVRGEMLVGEVEYSLDAVSGGSRLVVYDNNDAVLLDAQEQLMSCDVVGGTTRCREITIITARDNIVEGVSPFRVRESDLEFVDHFFYQRQVWPREFEEQFLDSFDWLVGVLTSVNPGDPVTLPTQLDRVAYHTKIDPLVGRYAHLLTYREGGQVLVVSGIMPSDLIYGRALDIAHEVGYRWVNPQIQINGFYYDYDREPRLYRCERS